MRVVVIGASLAGLFAAAAAAANGADTVILERDRLPKTPEPRRGVPQGRQAHVLLYRGLLSAEELLPGLREDLIAHGAARFDSGTMPWLGEYGWLPTWWQGFELVSVTGGGPAGCSGGWIGSPTSAGRWRAGRTCATRPATGDRTWDNGYWHAGAWSWATRRWPGTTGPTGPSSWPTT
jgi:hypothetical protein